MAWKKTPEELTVLHAELVKGFECEKRKMFGCQVFFVNGNMFTGVYEEGIMMHLSPADRDAVIGKHDEIVPFTPMGREMKGYVFVSGELLSDPVFLDEVKAWIGRSHAFVSSLPQKEKKPKTK